MMMMAMIVINNKFVFCNFKNQNEIIVVQNLYFSVMLFGDRYLMSNDDDGDDSDK